MALTAGRPAPGGPPIAFFKLPFQFPKTESEVFRNAATMEAGEQRYAGSLHDTSNPLQGTNWTKLPMNTQGIFVDSPLSVDLTNDTYVARTSGLYHAVGSCEVQLNNNPQRFLLSLRRNQIEDTFTWFGSGVTNIFPVYVFDD